MQQAASLCATKLIISSSISFIREIEFIFSHLTFNTYSVYMLNMWDSQQNPQYQTAGSAGGPVKTITPKFGDNYVTSQNVKIMSWAWESRGFFVGLRGTGVIL